VSAEEDEVPEETSGGRPASVSHSLVKALRGVPDFASLDDHALLKLVGASVNLAYSDGSVVFEPDSAAEALYIVLSGQVRILDQDQGGEVEVSRVGPGESFGELSLLLGRKHSKTAQAVTETELMVIPRELFEEVLATNEDLAETFHRRLQARQVVQPPEAQREEAAPLAGGGIQAAEPG